MGTPEFAVAPLKALVESGHHVVGVVTVPDKPAGRGLRLQHSAVKIYAEEKGLPVLQPVKLRDPEFLDRLRSLEPDLGIVIAFRMLPEVVWNMPRMGTFNLHASLLPQYRGAAPINWAVINGESETGVTTFLLNHEIDKGAVLGQKKLSVGKDETAGQLHDRLMDLGTELVLDTVEKIAAGKLEPIEQDRLTEGTLKEAPKIFKETCRIDWNEPLGNIHNKIRGLSPYPGAWTEWVGNGQRTTMKVFRAVPMDETADPKPAGTLATDGKNYLRVRTSGGWMELQEIQLAGKKRMTAEEFLRGFKNPESFRVE